MPIIPRARKSGRDAPSPLTVKALRASATTGVLRLGSLTLPCALGRSGVSVRKREGDGATPRGSFRLLCVFYNPLTTRRPQTSLPVAPVTRRDGWCDDPTDRNYNRRVRHPYPASAERLFRSDAVYDVIVVIDYNIRPRIRYRGSAIFMHVARQGPSPTEGCVALRKADLLRVLKKANRHSRLIISG